MRRTTEQAEAIVEVADEAIESTNQQDDAKPVRRRRSSVGGHAMKLSAPKREGHERRWVNDDKNRIAEIEELGYTFVSETGIKTHSPGSRVSRLVGTKANGEPLLSYLMETPDELYAQGVSEKEDELRENERGMFETGDTQGSQLSAIPRDERYGKVSVEQRDRL